MHWFGFSVIAAVLVMPLVVFADQEGPGTRSVLNCLVTLPADDALRPGSPQLFGTDTFAVSLPANGVWQVTNPGARIAVKLFWRSAGFRPGMEKHLSVDITNLDGGPNDAVVRGITNANTVPQDIEKAQADDDWLDGWQMLTGIDFPSAGCWQVTGTYLGQSLTFIVQTVDPEVVKSTSGNSEEPLSAIPTGAKTLMRATPYFENGEHRGFRLYAQANLEVFLATGFRPGDLLTNVEGRQLDHPSSAVELFDRLDQGETVDVTVLRRGELIELSVRTDR